MRCLWYAPARLPQVKMITLAKICHTDRKNTDKTVPNIPVHFVFPLSTFFHLSVLLAHKTRSEYTSAACFHHYAASTFLKRGIDKQQVFFGAASKDNGCLAAYFLVGVMRDYDHYSFISVFTWVGDYRESLCVFMCQPQTRLRGKISSFSFFCVFKH